MSPETLRRGGRGRRPYLDDSEIVLTLKEKRTKRKRTEGHEVNRFMLSSPCSGCRWQRGTHTGKVVKKVTKKRDSWYNDCPAWVGAKKGENCQVG